MNSSKTQKTTTTKMRLSTPKVNSSKTQTTTKIRLSTPKVNSSKTQTTTKQKYVCQLRKWIQAKHKQKQKYVCQLRKWIANAKCPNAKCTHVQMHKCTNAQMYKCTNAQPTDVPLHGCSLASCDRWHQGTIPPRAISGICLVINTEQNVIWQVH